MNTSKSLMEVFNEYDDVAVSENVYDILLNATMEFHINNGRECLYIEKRGEPTVGSLEPLLFNDFRVLRELDDSLNSRHGLWVPLEHDYIAGVIVKVIEGDEKSFLANFWCTYVTKDGALCCFSEIHSRDKYIHEKMDVLIATLMANPYIDKLKGLIETHGVIVGKTYGIPVGDNLDLWLLDESDVVNVLQTSQYTHTECDEHLNEIQRLSIELEAKKELIHYLNEQFADKYVEVKKLEFVLEHRERKLKEFRIEIERLTASK